MSTVDPEPFLSHFGLSSFRPGQRQVIDAVLAGQDCLCIMPTGGGKSLCYQLPAIARGGLTLVVSPLIALMKDQVDSLSAIGIRSTCINSSLSPSEQRSRMDAMSAGQYSMVYIAPERLRNTLFLEKLKSANVQLLAVDEAHCISEWGHDFRPDYARLGKLRERIGSPQTIALTATATPTVRDDVAKQLQLREPQVFITGFARPNLHFEVWQAAKEQEKQQLLLEFLESTPGSGIVYAATRKRCEELHLLLTHELARKQRSVGLYHAGLSPDDRRLVQDEFMSGRVPIIIATNAFGMGIDKSDLRFVVHYNMPGSLEAYYQEAGRAGRDGLRSRCLLLASHGDRRIQEFFIDSSYPPKDVIASVYEFLRCVDADPIQLTLNEIKETLRLPVSGEGVSASEKILERAGVLERLDSRHNLAAFRLETDVVELADLVPKEAKNQRKLLKAIDQLIDGVRHERVYVSPERLARVAELEGASLQRALREVAKLPQVDYLPPFRGRATHMLVRDKPFSQLGIDFIELDRRKNAEYAKLDAVIHYADARRCRQCEILDYFGDGDAAACGMCDNCGGVRRVAIEERPRVATPAVIEAVRIVLSGTARMRGKCGKQLLAKMLCGSQSSQVNKLGLQQLSTFGLLKHLTQPEVLLIVDALIRLRLIEQFEEQKFRPTVRITPLGEQVMRGTAPLPGNFDVDVGVVARLSSVGLVSPASMASLEESTASPTVASSVAPPVSTNRAEVAPGDLPVNEVSSDDLEPDLQSDFFVDEYVGEKEIASDEAIVQILGEADTSFDLRDKKESAKQENGKSTSGLAEAATEQASSHKTEGSSLTRIDSPRHAPDYYWTWRLLVAGLSLEECTQIRRISAETAYDQLLRAVRGGLTAEWRWVMTAAKWKQLGEWLDAVPTAELSSRMQSLPTGISFRDVQLYVLCREQQLPLMSASSTDDRGPGVAPSA